mgnify:CR=1 FL=1
MANNVPLVFRAWKEMVFERRANRIHDMLSSQGGDSPNRAKEDRILSNPDGNEFVNKTGSEFYNGSRGNE